MVCCTQQQLLSGRQAGKEVCIHGPSLPKEIAAAITISINNYINKLPAGFMAANQIWAHTFFRLPSCGVHQRTAIAAAAVDGCDLVLTPPINWMPARDWRLEVLCPTGMGRIN